MPVRLRGTRWSVDIVWAGADGARRRIRRNVDVSTEQEAKAIEQAWLAQLAAEDAPVLVAEVKQAAFSGFAVHWLETFAKADVKPSTFNNYERNFRVHLVPALGDADLRAITPERVQALKAELLTKVAPKSVANALGVLGSMFTTAVKWGYAEHNPVRAVTAPKARPAPTAWLTPEQTTAFLAAADQTEPRWGAFLRVLVRTGLRLGELTALRWGDVDLERRQVHVWRSVTEGAEGTPKSGRARHVALTTDACEAFLRQPRSAGGIVFPSEGGGHVRPSVIWRAVQRVTAAADLPDIRVHDLRHTFASQLVAKGVPLAAVQVLLGHSDIRMTLRYAHLAPSDVASWVSVLETPPGTATGSSHARVTTDVHVTEAGTREAV